MAYDKSIPCGSAYPVLPDMLDDDDEYILHEVKMLSLITAQQEQERRERLQRELSLARNPSDPSLRSSSTLQESSSLPELVGSVGVESSSGMVEVAGVKAGVNTQIARPRPQPGRTVQGIESSTSTIPSSGATSRLPSGSSVPPPLPAIRPNARSRLQTEAVRIPSPPRVVQRNRQDIPPRPRDTSANRSQSLSPPFHRTALTPYSTSGDLPLQGCGSNDAPLISLSPPPSRFVRMNFDFDLQSFDPLQPVSVGPTSIWHNSANIPRPSTDRPVPTYHNSSVPYPPNSSHFPPSPFVGGNDAIGGCPVVLGFMPWVTNDLGSPSSPGFSMSWMTDSGGNVPPSSTAATEITSGNTHTGLSGSGSTAESDLMDFSTDPVYMNLADFDPLYTVDSRGWSSGQRFESDRLFLRPGSPPPHSAAIPSARPTVAEQPLAPLPDVVVQSSVSRMTSVDELQDPFSVQDLMVSLEKKRQKHAHEQAVTADTSPPAHSVPSANEASSIRKVLLTLYHHSHSFSLSLSVIVLYNRLMTSLLLRVTLSSDSRFNHYIAFGFCQVAEHGGDSVV